MKVKITIDEILFPELVQMLQACPNGTKNKTIVALANRAYLSEVGMVTTLIPSRTNDTTKRKASGRKTQQKEETRPELSGNSIKAKAGASSTLVETVIDLHEQQCDSTSKPENQFPGDNPPGNSMEKPQLRKRRRIG